MGVLIYRIPWDILYKCYCWLSCSWHQTTKPRILFSPIFSTKFSQLEQLEKKSNILLVQNRSFLSFGPMKSLFSFSSGQSENNSRKKLGKTKFVVWWFDVTNKIVINYYSFLKEGHFASSWYNNLWKYSNMPAALEVSLRVNQWKPRPIIYGNWKN